MCWYATTVLCGKQFLLARFSFARIYEAHNPRTPKHGHFRIDNILKWMISCECPIVLNLKNMEKWTIAGNENKHQFLMHSDWMMEKEEKKTEIKIFAESVENWVSVSSSNKRAKRMYASESDAETKIRIRRDQWVSWLDFENIHEGWSIGHSKFDCSFSMPWTINTKLPFVVYRNSRNRFLL